MQGKTLQVFEVGIYEEKKKYITKKCLLKNEKTINEQTIKSLKVHFSLYILSILKVQKLLGGANTK